MLYCKVSQEEGFIRCLTLDHFIRAVSTCINLGLPFDHKKKLASSQRSNMGKSLFWGSCICFVLSLSWTWAWSYNFRTMKNNFFVPSKIFNWCDAWWLWLVLDKFYYVNRCMDLISSGPDPKGRRHFFCLVDRVVAIWLLEQWIQNAKVKQKTTDPAKFIWDFFCLDNASSGRVHISSMLSLLSCLRCFCPFLGIFLLLRIKQSGLIQCHLPRFDSLQNWKGSMRMTMMNLTCEVAWKKASLALIL